MFIIGIIFNNQMDDFSSPNSSNYFNLAPFESNYIMPGKTPLSSMSPSFILHNDVSTNRKRVRIVGGASGGPKIITATTQMILNLIGFGFSGLESILNRRIHAQLLPNVVNIETFNPLEQNSIEALLVSKGQVVSPSSPLGAAQFIGS